ncbi:hypothetical protein RhiirC2_804967 [Rhizophagus irregularis]|uniref:Uncharacterized protein n=1 Tax=Rhizophagus irregularis TaxID=588596 RepID=A0A2N1KVQ7_9GLOM|nr:hypothetical protein RhiirC2_804967 [Rhizophagus irregularis]
MLMLNILLNNSLTSDRKRIKLQKKLSSVALTTAFSLQNLLRIILILLLLYFSPF